MQSRRRFALFRHFVDKTNNCFGLASLANLDKLPAKPDAVMVQFGGSQFDVQLDGTWRGPCDAEYQEAYSKAYLEIIDTLKQNFDVLKPSLGLNSTRDQQAQFSLRTEWLRILPAGTNAAAAVPALRDGFGDALRGHHERRQARGQPLGGQLQRCGTGKRQGGASSAGRPRAAAGCRPA